MPVIISCAAFMVSCTTLIEGRRATRRAIRAQLTDFIGSVISTLAEIDTIDGEIAKLPGQPTRYLRKKRERLKRYLASLAETAESIFEQWKKLVRPIDLYNVGLAYDRLGDSRAGRCWTQAIDAARKVQDAGEGDFLLLQIFSHRKHGEFLFRLQNDPIAGRKQFQKAMSFLGADTDSRHNECGWTYTT
jgi:hypothetical protein